MRKVKIKVNKNYKKILLIWMKVSRLVYNKTVEVIKEKLEKIKKENEKEKIKKEKVKRCNRKIRKLRIYGKTFKYRKFKKWKKTSFSDFTLRDIMKEEFEELINETYCPNTIVEYAVFQAYEAYKNALSNYKKNKTPFNISFRSCRAYQYSIKIDGRSYKNGYIYKNNTKNLLTKIYEPKLKLVKKQKDKQEIIKDEFNKMKIYETENIPKLDNITDIIYDRQEGEFYLCYQTTYKIKKYKKKDLVSLDPGEIAFLTYYDGLSWGKIGNKDFTRINRLLIHHDNLISKISKVKQFFKKSKMKKAAYRIRKRIKDSISDFHWKVANFLTKGYKHILLPKYETSNMIRHFSKFKLHKWSRSMQTWSHYKFKQKLIQKAKQNGSTIIHVNEAYTSKTCSNCGNIKKINGGIYKCKKCNLVINRDLNGAKNIMIRTLTSFLSSRQMNK